MYLSKQDHYFIEQAVKDIKAGAVEYNYSIAESFEDWQGEGPQYEWHLTEINAKLGNPIPIEKIKKWACTQEEMDEFNRQYNI